MEKTLQKPSGRSRLAHVPAFAVCPAPRCGYRADRPEHPFCGELATAKRLGNDWFADAYFCGEHAQPTDMAVAGELVVRRVRVEGQILIAGVSMGAPECQAEALARLDAALKSVGAVLEPSAVRSTFGKYLDYVPAGGANASRDGRR